MHNLFGDTEAVDVFVFPDGSVEVELSDEGDTVADMQGKFLDIKDNACCRFILHRSISLPPFFARKRAPLPRQGTRNGAHAKRGLV